LYKSKRLRGDLYQEAKHANGKEYANASASREADVEQHGDEAKAFSHHKAIHHFLLYPDGGAVEVTAKDRASPRRLRIVPRGGSGKADHPLYQTQEPLPPWLERAR